MMGNTASLSQRFKLLKGLLHGEKAFTGPLYVDIDLTSRCNIRCIGCPYHSPLQEKNPMASMQGRDMDVDLFKRLVVELQAMGTNSIILQGSGEPLLHPRTPEMIAFAKGLGLRVVLLTNGTLLTSDICSALIDSGLDLVKVSLWAANRDQYEVNAGVPSKHFDRTIEGLGQFAALKKRRNTAAPDVFIYHIINAQNFSTLDKMVDLAIESGCQGLHFTPFYALPGKSDHLALKDEDEQEVRRSIRAAGQRLRSMSMSCNVDWALNRYDQVHELWQTMACTIAWFHARIRVDGTVQGCGRCNLNLSFGNIQKESFRKVWNGSLIKRFRKQAAGRARSRFLSAHCDCSSCCYYHDIARIHRYLRFVPRFNNIRRRTALQ